MDGQTVAAACFTFPSNVVGNEHGMIVCNSPHFTQHMDTFSTDLKLIFDIPKCLLKYHCSHLKKTYRPNPKTRFHKQFATNTIYLIRMPHLFDVTIWQASWTNFANGNKIQQIVRDQNS